MKRVGRYGSGGLQDWLDPSTQCERQSEILGANAHFFSEPVRMRLADDFERRVAAMDRAARGSVTQVPARQPCRPVQPFPHDQDRTVFVHFCASEPACWWRMCVGAVAITQRYGAGVRTFGRWSASCRSAVTGQHATSDQLAILGNANQRATHGGCFRSGDNTANILHVGRNWARAGLGVPQTG